MSDFNLLLLSPHSAPRTECTNPTAACRTWWCPGDTTNICIASSSTTNPHFLTRLGTSFVSTRSIHGTRAATTSICATRRRTRPLRIGSCCSSRSTSWGWIWKWFNLPLSLQSLRSVHQVLGHTWHRQSLALLSVADRQILSGQFGVLSDVQLTSSTRQDCFRWTRNIRNSAFYTHTTVYIYATLRTWIKVQVNDEWSG